MKRVTGIGGIFFKAPALNRTRNGMPRLGLISFWPRRVTPSRAG
jgi:hypothetical protein